MTDSSHDRIRKARDESRCLGGALYACAPLMRICEGFGWDYIFTFKEGRTPTAYADAQKLMGATPPGQSGRPVRHDRRGKRVECGEVPYLSYRRYGKSIVIVGGESLAFNVYRLLTNFLRLAERR